MKLGKFKMVGARAGAHTRRAALGGLAMTVAALGTTGVQPARGDAASAEVAGSSVTTSTTTAPVEPPPTTTTTSTTAPPEPPPTTTTTTVPPDPPPTTTTTTVPPEPPPPTTTTAPPGPAERTAGAAEPSRQEQIEAIADESRWDWRSAGVRLFVGFHPEDCCHWGVYDARSATLWIGPSAFKDAARLRYVVLHELAHAWQYHTARFGEYVADFSPWGWSTVAQALEAGADCIASLWGASGSHYWRCPSDAQALAARRLAGVWS